MTPRFMPSSASPCRMSRSAARRFAGFERGDGELQWNLAMQVRGPLQIHVRPLAA